MASKSQLNKYLEWCTKLPTKDYPRKSPVFLVNGNEWFFEFLLEQESDPENDTWYYNLNLNWKCTHTEFKPCHGKLQVIVEVVILEVPVLRVLSDKEFNVSKPETEEIWYTIMEELKEKLPPRKGIKFFFALDDVPESLLKIKTIKDKSVQTGSYLNANVSVESLYKDFSKLLDAGPNHDAEIMCGEYAMKVHRLILSARSKVFSKMFQSNKLMGTSRIIEIQDMGISCLQDFVKYLYTGALPELTFDKAKMLYEAGDKYAVRSLMIRCSDYLQDNLSPDNVSECFALADAHSDQNLKNRVKNYMVEKKIYLQDELWLPFTKRFPTVAIEVYRLSHKRKASERDDQ